MTKLRIICVNIIIIFLTILQNLVVYSNKLYIYQSVLWQRDEILIALFSPIQCIISLGSKKMAVSYIVI